MKYLFVVQGEGRGHFTSGAGNAGANTVRGDEIAAFWSEKLCKTITRLFPKSGNSTGYSIRES